MLNLATQNIDVAKLLPFVEAWGGLVIPINERQEIATGVFQTKTYPVSCGTSYFDCFQKGYYQRLVPNSNKKSIAYFEERESMKFLKFEGAKNLLMNFSGVVRFVCWVNLKKLGIAGDVCNFSGSLALETMLKLQGKRSLIIADTEQGKIQLTPVRQVIKNEKIFAAYSYSELQSLMMYPYDYFAVDFRVDMQINRACIELMQTGETLEC